MFKLEYLVLANLNYSQNYIKISDLNKMGFDVQ